jgi:hypothetical protein
MSSIFRDVFETIFYQVSGMFYVLGYFAGVVVVFVEL